MDVFKLEHAVKQQGRDFRLGPLDLHLVPGEILGVMGADGAGKTTLLRMLWGFLRPDEGSVSVLGRSPHLHQVWIRVRAGYLAESPRYYDWMRGLQLLEFVSRFYPTWDWDHARRLLRLFELDPDQTIGEMSKGSRTKLGLIAALTHRPLLLVLDEPTAGLEPLVRAEILDSLREIARSDETGIVFSSHLSGDLDRIAHTVLMLDRGRVVGYAPRDTLLEHYAETRLEEVFLHAMDRIPTPGAGDRP